MRVQSGVPSYGTGGFLGGTHLNYVLKEKEALVREECSRREEFGEDGA